MKGVVAKIALAQAAASGPIVAELDTALADASKYLTLRALTSGPALRLSAALMLARERRSGQVEVAVEILDYLAGLGRSPAALIAVLQAGLNAQRNAVAAACGSCGAHWPQDQIEDAKCCPHCGTERTQ